MYKRMGPGGESLFGDPNVDVNCAARSTVSVWWQWGQVGIRSNVTLPQLPPLSPKYGTDSTIHTREIRQLQGFLAEVNFKHRFLRCLLGELINVILDMVPQQDDQRRLGTR